MNWTLTCGSQLTWLWDFLRKTVLKAAPLLLLPLGPSIVINMPIMHGATGETLCSCVSVCVCACAQGGGLGGCVGGGGNYICHKRFYDYVSY